MSKIPTAEEFFDIWLIKKGYIALQGFEQLDQEDLSDYAIEFAKLHVESALKKASEKAEMNCNCDGDEYCHGKIDKKSILNAYPLENIK